MSQKMMKARLHRSYTQAGMTLIELMVGILVGLLVIAVAGAALMASRNVSQSVSDNTFLQQQASYIFRMIGQQVRQSGSLYLNLAVGKGNTDAIDPSDLVAFSPNALVYGPNATFPTIKGEQKTGSTSDSISVAYQNYFESSYLSTDKISLLTDCQGVQPSAASNTQVINNTFSKINNNLSCTGVDGVTKSIAENISDFQVRYFVQTDAAAGSPKIQKVVASAVTDWSNVFGVEVCMVLYGEQKSDIPSGSTYLGCDTTAPIDIGSTSTAVPSAEKGRLHMTFRNVYQLRSQGLV